jgi:hypothetical protein
MGLPALFLAFLDLRAVSERAALRTLEYDKWILRGHSRGLEEMASICRTRHCYCSQRSLLENANAKWVVTCKCLDRNWTLKKAKINHGHVKHVTN